MGLESLNNLREDFFVKASLDISGEKIEGIPCKIYLPESTMEKPFFWFRPPKAQYDILKRAHSASFRASIDGFNQKKEVELFSSKVYFSGKSTRHWGPDFSESTFKGEPENLKIVESIGSKEEKESDRAFLRIWISPNSVLGPDMLSESSYLGDIKYDRINQIGFTITDKLAVSFDTHFKTTTQENGNLRQVSYLVACAEIDLASIEDANFEDDILAPIDSFLSVASLGSRTRTACLGWEASTNRRIIKYYRGGFFFPSGKSEFLINCAFPDDFRGSDHTINLIQRSHFEDYLKTCYAALVSHHNPKVLSDSIFSVVPGRRRTVEDAFLSMYSALESLILDYRKRNDLEYVISDENEWKDKKKGIQKALRKMLKDYTGKQRCFMYGKLDELNRIPSRSAFSEFCREYNLDVSDLWPLYGEKFIAGLSDIRNLLIHGIRISGEFNKMLSEAKESLQYMLERTLLSLMGFPVQESDVSKSLLSCDPYRLNWTVDEQKNFKDYIDGR